MTNITHNLEFNGDSLELNADFRGNNVHITVTSKLLGDIGDSTAFAKDYNYLLDASPKELDDYIMIQLAFYAYYIAEKVEELEA